LRNLEQIFNSTNKIKGNLISIILPLYNEEDSLPLLLNELTEFLSTNLKQYNFEISFIDDCSTDNSYNIISNYSINSSFENIRISVLQLAKNSGSHIAITAGLNISKGDFTIIMASDGQDPANIIEELILGWQKGNDLILASRSDNLGHGFFSNLLSKLAWKIMNWSTGIQMPSSGCDLLGMDRIVLDSFNSMNERNTTFIFRILSLGFKQTEIKYIKRERFGGKSSWTIRRKIAIMADAISGFSNRPLKLIANFGLLFALILFIRWIYVISKILFINESPSDLTILLNTFFSGLAIQLIVLGFMGDYIWRILDETRKRPMYSFRKFNGKIF
jgi:glycosyltransferase involved in cell wall biosynthesis